MKIIDLNFKDLCIDDEFMYFSASDFNGLFRWKEGEEYTEWLGQFPEEPSRQKFLHYKVVKYDRKIFFTPFSGHGIHIYDMEKNSLKIYIIDSEKELSFSNAVEIKGKIYLVPLNVHTPFMIYDIKNESICRVDDFWGKIGTLYKLNDGNFVGGFGALQVDQMIYMTVVGLNIFISYDTETHAMQINKIDFNPRGIYYLEKEFYFTVLNSSKIIKYDMERNMSEEIIPASSIITECPFSSVLKFQKHLFLMPGGSNTDVTEVSFAGKNIELSKIALNYLNENVHYEGLYKNYVQKDKMIFFLPKIGNGITALDLCEKSLRSYQVRCDPSYSELYYALQNYDDMEQDEHALERYMGILIHDFYRIIESRNNRAIGERVWKILNKEDEK